MEGRRSFLKGMLGLGAGIVAAAAVGTTALLKSTRSLVRTIFPGQSVTIRFDKQVGKWVAEDGEPAFPLHVEEAKSQ